MSDEEAYMASPMPGEPALWYSRYTRFRLLWPHSIPEAYRAEKREKQRKADADSVEIDENRRISSSDLPLPPGVWYQMSRTWCWQERVAAYDAWVTADLEKAHKDERARALAEGYAPMHRRVMALNAKVEQLLAATEQEDRVWLRDAKMLGEERMDLVRFNAPLFEQLRACLADISAELGERVKKTELSAKIHNSGRIAVVLPRKKPVDSDPHQAQPDSEGSETEEERG